MENLIEYNSKIMLGKPVIKGTCIRKYEYEFDNQGNRIFCFFDEGKLIILMNGFQKKTRKTPKQEIEQALKIKEEYYAEK